MPLWRIYYHLVWTTKDRLPMITADLEQPLFDYIIGKAEARQTIVHAIGGIEDHVHLVASIHPKHAIAEVVKQLKGASGHWANERKGAAIPFVWQRGYGVFSLGAKQVGEAVEYVRRQKEHHREGSVIRWLERASDEDEGPERYREGTNES